MTATPRKVSPSCPHCGDALQALRIPDGGGWEPGNHWVCFNDECPYYRDGWEWMREKYEVKASYRYRIVDTPGAKASPIAVWSPTALRDHIIADPTI